MNIYKQLAGPACFVILASALVGLPLSMLFINPPHQRPVVDFTKTDSDLPPMTVDLDEDGATCGSREQMKAVGGAEVKVDLSNSTFEGMVCWEIPTTSHAVAADDSAAVQ